MREVQRSHRLGAAVARARDAKAIEIVLQSHSRGMLTDAHGG